MPSGICRTPRFKTDKSRTYFLVELPIQPQMKQAHDEAHVSMNATEQQIIKVLGDGPKSMPEILRSLGSKSFSGVIKKAIRRLDGLGLIAMTIPDKPRSKQQKRCLTAKGDRVASALRET
jgi:ATP-dependent DNA helicase RecG